MVVIPGTEDEISACVAFLKWFTQPENNLQFSVQSGYMPVTYAANSISALENSGLTVSDRIHKVLSLSIDASSTPPMPSRMPCAPAIPCSTRWRTVSLPTMPRCWSGWPPGRPPRKPKPSS